MRIRRNALLLLAALCLCCAPALADGGAQLIGEATVSSLAGGVMPSGWTTQETGEDLSDMLDGYRDTSYSHTCWSSKSKDTIPEITFWFGGVTLREIWVRNGDQSDYSSYYASARIKKLNVSVYQADGSSVTYQYQMQDTYDPDGVSSGWIAGYQRVALPREFRNVTRVELWITGWYQGNTERYIVRVSDIVFMPYTVQDSGSWYPATPQPSQNNGWGGYHPQVRLNQRLATRSGPGTQYTELGSYFQAGTTLTAISAAYDDRNGIWWIQTEFSYGGELRRAYTGLKRLEMQVSDVPVEYVVTPAAVVNRSVYAYWGPGYGYSMYKNPIPAGTEGIVWQVENGYAQLEFYDSAEGKTRRVWIPESSLDTSFG